MIRLLLLSAAILWPFSEPGCPGPLFRLGQRPVVSGEPAAFLDWSNRVWNAGSTANAVELTAARQFALDTAGIAANIVQASFVAGADTNAVMQPFYPVGSAAVTLENSDLMTYDRTTGLKGNGASTYVGSGITMAALYAGNGNNVGLVVCYDAYTGGGILLNGAFETVDVDMPHIQIGWDTGELGRVGDTLIDFAGVSLYNSIFRTGTTSYINTNAVLGGSAENTIGLDGTINTELYFLAMNNDGTPGWFTSDRLLFWAIVHDWDATKDATLYSAVTNFFTGIGRTIP